MVSWETQEQIRLDWADVGLRMGMALDSRGLQAGEEDACKQIVS